MNCDTKEQLAYIERMNKGKLPRFGDWGAKARELLAEHHRKR